MANNITIGMPSPVWYAPWGKAGIVSIYVKDTTLGERDFTDNIVSWDFNLVQNLIATGTVHLYSVDTNDQLHLQRGNKVKIFVGNTLWYVYQIQKVAFDSTTGCVLTLEGIECKGLRNFAYDATNQTFRVNYDDTDSATITNALISGVFSAGTIDSFGKVFYRAEYDRVIKGLMNQAETHKADWWLSWKPEEEYNVDYYNLTQRRGTTDSKFTFSSSGENQNIFLTSNAESQNNIKNYIICMGAGTEINSVNYHATTNRTYLNGGDTWLNGAITATNTTLVVDSTSGFSAGWVLGIGTEYVYIDSITNGTTMVVQRGYGSTTAISHADKDEVLSLNYLKVDDNSSFPSSGTVWVGSERMIYDSKGSTTLHYSGTSMRGYFKEGTSGVVTPKYAHIDNIEVYDAQYDEDSAQSGSSISDNGLTEARYDFNTVIDRNALDLAAQCLLAQYKDVKSNILIVPWDLHEILDIVKLQIGDNVTINDTEAGLSGDYEIKSFHLYRPHNGDEALEIEFDESKTNYVKNIADTQNYTGNISSYAQGSPVIVSDSESDNCDTNYNIDLDIVVPTNTIAVKNMNLYYNIDAYRVYSTTTAGGSSHTHSTSISAGGGHTHSISASGAHTHSTSISSGGAHEHAIGSILAAWSTSFPESKWVANTSGVLGGTGAHTHGAENSSSETHTHSATSSETHTHGAETSSADTTHTHTVTYGISEVAAEGGNDISIYVDTTNLTALIETDYGTLSTSLMNEINLAKYFTFEAGKRYTLSVRPIKKCWIHAGVQGELFIKSGG